MTKSQKSVMWCQLGTTERSSPSLRSVEPGIWKLSRNNFYRLLLRSPHTIHKSRSLSRTNSRRRILTKWRREIEFSALPKGLPSWSSEHGESYSATRKFWLTHFSELNAPFWSPDHEFEMATTWTHTSKELKLSSSPQMPPWDPRKEQSTFSFSS